jgi:hypothetical protein
MSGIVKSIKNLPEPIPIDISLIREHMAIFAPIIVEVNGQKTVAELLQLPKARSVHILVTGIITEADGGITAEFSQNAV